MSQIVMLGDKARSAETRAASRVFGGTQNLFIKA